MARQSLLRRAILSVTGPMNLWSRPWKGLGLPMRILYGPTSMGRLRFDDNETPGSLPAVIGALSLLCDATVATEWSIVRKINAREGVQVVENIAAAHALAAWPLHERWAWLHSALFMGNGVAHVERDGRGAPWRLVAYPAMRVTFRFDERGRLFLVLLPIAGAESIEVAESECAVLRYRPIGSDPRVGISPLLQASPTIDLLLNNRRMVQATMRNAARPSGYLSTDGRIDPQRATEIRERWRSAYGTDGENAGGTAVLESGLKYVSIPLNDLQELAAVETARMGVGDVARLYGIPPSLLLGIEQNRATAAEDRRRLGTFCIEPLSRLAEDALAQALLTEEQRAAGYGVRIDQSSTLLGQGSELGQAISSLLNSGAVSVNEARMRIGLGAVADGDLLRSPTNTWPLEAWATAVPRSADTIAANDPAPVRAMRLMTRRRLQ